MTRYLLLTVIFVEYIPLSYTPTQWSIVFPLGMYTVTSYQLALAAEFEPLQKVAHVMLWVALAVWFLVAIGLLHRLTRKHYVKALQ